MTERLIQVAEQYRTSAHLDVRIGFHKRFSANPYCWMWWVFDHFEFPAACRALELGCGPGNLWLENIHRIGAGWDITLSDLSAGMLDKARATLASVEAKFDFKMFGAESIPFDSDRFDAVIANHMLYYVADLDQTLSEIRRVLKPGGRLYASTNGMSHLKEIDDLIVGFRAGPQPIASVIQAFSLDNGRNYLERHFEAVKVYRQDNGLRVADAAALAAFGLSVTRAEIPQERHSEFVEYVEHKMRACGGEMRIAKNAGLFTAVKTPEPI